MPRRYTDIQCIGYNSTDELQEHAAEIINKWQGGKYFVEVHYAINSGMASALLLRYFEEEGK